MSRNQKNIEVSVIIPVFNAENYIGATLETLVNQDMQNFETVCVDDGSTDTSLEIINTFQDRLNLKIISRPNTGIVGALNDGIDSASGSLITRLDADDLCHPRRLSQQLAFMNSHLDVVAVGSSAALIDEVGRKIGVFPAKVDHGSICDGLFRGESMIHHPSVMMRKQAVERIGAYREGYCPAEDYDLWLRLTEVGQLANIQEALITKRQLLTGLVATRFRERDRVVQKALSEVWQSRNFEGEVPIIQPGFIKSEDDIIKQWIWLAMNSKNISTARYYAFKYFLRFPISIERIKTLFITLIRL